MENFAKLKTQDIKSQAERKDIYLDNDFIAISKYIKITDEDINVFHFPIFLLDNLFR